MQRTVIQSLPKTGQLFRAKIGEHLSIHFQHGREFLAGEADHFVKSGFVGGDINFLVFNVMFIKPANGFVTPAAVRLDEETCRFRFHIHTVADDPSKINCRVPKNDAANWDRSDNSGRMAGRFFQSCQSRRRFVLMRACYNSKPSGVLSLFPASVCTAAIA